MFDLLKPSFTFYLNEQAWKEFITEFSVSGAAPRRLGRDS